jgi:hypothetical protein
MLNRLMLRSENKLIIKIIKTIKGLLIQPFFIRAYGMYNKYVEFLDTLCLF